jgi:hypothetical protein
MCPIDMFIIRVLDTRDEAATQVAAYPRLNKIQAYGMFCARLARVESMAVRDSLESAEEAYAAAVRFAKEDGIL